MIDLSTKLDKILRKLESNAERLARIEETLERMAKSQRESQDDIDRLSALTDLAG